jgi:SAM-dependent methyltransferase
MEQMTPLLSLDEHCFFVGPRIPGKEILALPSALPFRLGVHPRYAIPTLIADSAISTALDMAYSQGSIASTPLGESPLAINRMSEMIDGLINALGKDVEGLNLLEIGAGSGGLMCALRDRGAHVTGIEIGPQGQSAAKKHNLKIIDSFFEPGLFSEPFDAIYSYGCLEHLSDLDTFFQAAHASLKDGGITFHMVPNSEPFFLAGSIEHLAHEHVNYFDATNGIRLFESQGFSSAQAAYSRAGNELMLWGMKNSRIESRWPVEAVKQEEERLSLYAKLLYDRTSIVQHALEELTSPGQSIGFYAGGYEYGFRMNGVNIRYFDGDAYNHGRVWLAGLAPIEAPEALCRNPVDHLVIFKPHYFDAIATHLNSLGVSSPRLWNVSQLGTRIV